MELLGVSIWAWLIWIGITGGLAFWAHTHGLDRGALKALSEGGHPDAAARVASALDSYVQAMQGAASRLHQVQSDLGSALRHPANQVEPPNLAESYFDTDDLLIDYGRMAQTKPLWVDRKLRIAGLGEPLEYYTIVGTSTVTTTPQAAV